MSFEADEMKTTGYALAELNDSIEQFKQAAYSSLKLDSIYFREPKPLNYYVDLYLQDARALDKMCQIIFGRLIKELDMPLLGEFYD